MANKTQLIEEVNQALKLMRSLPLGYETMKAKLRIHLLTIIAELDGKLP